MRKKRQASIAFALMLSLISYTFATASAKAEQTKDVAKVKRAIIKLGVGPAARIEVTLRDKTKLKGYVREASDDGFVVVDGKTGATSQVLYPAVRKVKGHNYETGEVIGYVLFFGMIVAWTILQLRE